MQNGVGDNITVASTTVNVPTQPARSSQVDQTIIKRLVRQELTLQEKQSRASESEPFIPYAGQPRESNAEPSEISGLKGKSFKTRFFGPSYPKSILSYTPGLTSLSKEIVESNPVLTKIRKDVRGMQHADEIERTSAVPRMDLLGLLPLQSEADSLVKLYLHNFDTIYHVLHRPTFEAEYEAMWANPADARPHFVALVLLIIASARSLKREEPYQYIGKNSIARADALSCVSKCEEWLRLNQNQKKATVTDFQIRFLVNLAKAVHGAQFKRGWTDATHFSRYCMAAGLHVEPTVSNGALEQELRRRIWFATSEFELQTAFVRGMPADPLSVESGIAPPSNIDDSDLAPEMSSRPQPRPTSTFCPASYLVLANQTFALRHRLSKLLNSSRIVLFEELRGLTEEIQVSVQRIPEWTEDSRNAAPRALLRVNLINYLLFLHTRQIQHATSTADRDYSIMTMIKAVTEMTAIHTSLLDGGCHVLQQLSHEELRPALSICYLVEKLDPGADRILCHLLKECAEQVTSGAIQVLTDKANLGAGRNKVWLSLLCDAFVKIWKHPAQKSTYVQEAVNRMAAGYYRVIASQTSDQSAAHGRASSLNGSTSLGTVASHPSSATPGLVQQGEEDISSIDMDEFSAWTFEEWAFDSHHFHALDNNVE